jgi:hypothetical protein
VGWGLTSLSGKSEYMNIFHSYEILDQLEKKLLWMVISLFKNTAVYRMNEQT